MCSFPIAVEIVKKLYQQGFTTYFAGGWVRDYLLQHPSDDIDIATTASVEEISALFPKTIPVGINFGIIIVVEQGHQFEMATFRKDQGYKDGRRPIGIDKATPEEDAKRRDFTINGMFYDPLKEEILDYVEGREDLKKGIVRAIGNPHERFLEDRLRMIRAVRYATRFKFSIEAETLKAILDHANALFPAVAIERVWHELIKMNNYPHLDLGLIILHRLNLLPVIFPNLQDLPIEEIQKRLSILPTFPKEAPLIGKILELFPSFSLNEKLELVSYLKLSNEERKFIEFYHHAKDILVQKKGKTSTLFDWAHFYASPYFLPCLKMIAIHYPLEERQTFLQEHAIRQNKLKEAIERIKRNTPLLTSSHLREAGILNGKQMGLLLKEGEKIAINEQLSDPKKVIELLKQTPFWRKESL